MGQKQTVRSNLRQSQRRHRTGVSDAPAQSIRPRRKSVSLCLLFKLSVKLFQRHTAVLWLVVGALLIGMTAAAMMSIMDPTASVVPPSKSSQSPIDAPQLAGSEQASSARNGFTAEQRPTNRNPAIQAESRPTQPASPLSAGSMLLLSCAGGCFLLSQWLKPQPTARRLAASKARTAKTKAARSNQTATASNKTLPTIVDQPSGLPQSPKRSPAIAAEVSRLKAALPERYEGEQAGDRTLLESGPTSKPATEVTVTVMPNGEIHPLDWDEPSLADNLDLRQQRPLSYWL